jgi:hypothetical protein
MPLDEIAAGLLLYERVGITSMLLESRLGKRELRER